MQVIRRLYLYVMSGITLAILGVGLRMLASVLLDTIIPAGVVIVGGDGPREQLSLAGALIGVGLPAWLIHWWLVRRGLQPSGEAGADAGAEERRSTIRALYVSIVLAACLLFIAAPSLDLVRAGLLVVLGLGGPPLFPPDVPESLATILVAGAVWLFHVNALREDVASGAMDEGAVWWPRTYLYGTLLVTLLLMLAAADDMLEGAVRILLDTPAAFGDARGLQVYAAAQAAAVLVMAVAFVGHTWAAGRLRRASGWLGEAEHRSALRVAFLVAVLGISAIAGLANLLSFGRALVLQVLGIPVAQLGFDGADIAAAGSSLVGLLPWLIAGFVARRVAFEEAAESSVHGRAAAVARLDGYVLSLVGLGFGAVGSAMVLGLAIDAVIGGTRLSLALDASKVELATFLPAAILGTALWAWRWWRVTAVAAADPVVEAASSIRRTALLMVLGVSLIVAVGSLATILYRLFNFLLGAPLGAAVASELSTPLGVLLVAAAVAVYHGALLRNDARLRAAGPMAAGSAPGALLTPRGSGGTGPLEMPAPAGPIEAASRSLVLRAPSTIQVEAALQTLRMSLPPGAQLDDA